MPEAYTCIECEDLYDWSDGDLNERMCNRCLNDERNDHYKKIVDRIDVLTKRNSHPKPPSKSQEKT
jgi:hypothetical protein